MLPFGHRVISIRYQVSRTVVEGLCYVVIGGVVVGADVFWIGLFISVFIVAVVGWWVVLLLQLSLSVLMW